MCYPEPDIHVYTANSRRRSRLIVREKTNLVRIIVGNKTSDKRRVDEMRVKESVKKKLVGSTRAGRVDK